MPAWIIDAAGFVTGIYDGPGQPANSVTVAPPANAVQPLRFIDGAWLTVSQERHPTIGPNEFYFLWTIVEQIAIEELRESDMGVKLFLRRLDDVRTTEVVLADPSVQDAVRHTVRQLVAKGVIDPGNADGRVAAILAGPAR